LTDLPAQLFNQQKIGEKPAAALRWFFSFLGEYKSLFFFSIDRRLSLLSINKSM